MYMHDVKQNEAEMRYSFAFLCYLSVCQEALLGRQFDGLSLNLSKKNKTEFLSTPNGKVGFPMHFLVILCAKANTTRESVEVLP